MLWEEVPSIPFLKMKPLIVLIDLNGAEDLQNSVQNHARLQRPLLNFHFNTFKYNNIFLL